MTYPRLWKIGLVKRLRLSFAVWLAAISVAGADDYRSLGYMYLSPLPGSEYTSPQTAFFLVRFQNLAPTAVTNLAQFIQVTGAASGLHTGRTWIAADRRTVILQNSAAFLPYEKVTVSLTPQFATGTIGSASPYQYQFAITGTMTNLHGILPPHGVITARGDNPPNETKDKLFDGIIGTKWLDFSVPNGAGNFSWIQYVYPTNDSRIAVQYALTSANDEPERDPADWHFYGVSSSNTLVLLDTRIGQVFPNRFQTLTYPLDNTNAYNGYRLEVTRIFNPPTSVAVQLAELQFLEPGGSPIITARGDNPPNETKDKAFDGNTASKWLDFNVPNGTDNFSWIQYSYPGIQSLVVTQYAISSANDVPERDPADWHLYGVSGSGALTLLDTQTGQSFPNRFQTKTYAVANTNAYRGYRLEITRVSNPAAAGAVQLSEFSLSPALSGLAPGVTVQGTPPPASGTTLPDEGPLPLLGDYVYSGNLAGIMPNGVSVPGDFPRIIITTNLNPDPDYIFIDNRGGGGHGYNVIFDNNGSPIWYTREPDEHRDMKVQPNGLMTMLARDGGLHFNSFDTHYQFVTNYWAVNGYSTDDHELQMLQDGSYYLLAMNTEPVDMTRFVPGGNPAAAVTEEILQGFSAAGELTFQFRTWDHFDIHDQAAFIDLNSSGFDFPHVNAIDFDSDGNLLLSSRSTSEITKINKDTGEIIWRLGGGHGQFRFPNDPLNGPRNQHAIRMIGTNHYTLFDNGDLHNPSVSRGVEYQLDLTNMTANIVWQYPNTTTPNLYSFYMGNVQRLRNGNTLINWAVGNLPKLTEIRPDGTKAFEMNWAGGWESYRVWRCPWQGSALKPYLIVEPNPDNITLIFNQFGDTNVAYYRIYGGTASQSTNLVATSGVTLKQLVNLQNGSTYYFRVAAVNRQGVQGPFSDEQSAVVSIVQPGQSTVTNGDFALGTGLWTWSLAGGATASWAVESGTAHIYITNGTTGLANIQLKQGGQPLGRGRKYVFEFDAWSLQPRYIQAIVAQDAAPNQIYGGPSSTYLTPVHNHFRYVFTMASPTDLSAGVCFNMGSASAGVFLDNVALYKVSNGDFNADKKVDLLDLQLLTHDWLKSQSGLSTDLDGNGKVDFVDFGVFGENWSP